MDLAVIAVLLSTSETVALLSYRCLTESSTDAGLANLSRSAWRVAKADIWASRFGHIISTIRVVFTWANSPLDPCLSLLTDGESLGLASELIVSVIILARCCIAIDLCEGLGT